MGNLRRDGPTALRTCRSLHRLVLVRPHGSPRGVAPGRCLLSRLRELVGRTRSEDGLAAVLDAGPASAEFVAPDGAWDWDAAWAASQSDEDHGDHEDDADAGGTAGAD